MEPIACERALPLQCRRATACRLRTATLFVLLLLAGIAPGLAQKVTLNAKGQQLETIFQDITRQTGYTFFYPEGFVKKLPPVTVTVNNEALEKALTACFEQAPLTFSIVEKTIVVKEKKNAATPALQATKAPPPIVINGNIINVNKEPLLGASVHEKGGTAKVLTKADGNFALTISKLPATLVVSYIGYQVKEIAVTQEVPVTVALEEMNKSMEDVVVIGYQAVKRKDLTGTVSSLSGAQLEKIPVSSAAEALTGRLPGVQVTTVDGQPGAEVVIRVRGGGSITGSNDPLYIVDGFRVNSINDIAPADIATIDILKDAATAAIYGAAGANGVIIITTKSAKGGKTSINYNGFMQSRQLPKKLEVLSPYEFVLAQYEYARLKSQTDVDNFTKYFGDYEDLELYKYQKGTDWQQQLYGSPSYSQQNSVSLTGGNDKTKVALNFTHNKEAGLIASNNFKRYYLNFKLNHEISKALKFDMAMRYTNTIINGAGSSGSSNFRIGDGITTRPVNGIADMVIIDPGAGDDYEQFLSSLVNPLKLTDQDYRKRTGRLFSFNAGLSWNINKSITYRTEASYGLSYAQNRRYYGPLTSTARNEGGNLPMGEITQTQTEDYRLTNTLRVAVKKNANHDLNVLLGQEILSRNKGFEEYNRAKYFNADILPEKLFATMSLGTQDQHTTTEMAADKTASFFGQAIYQFQKKYILNFTIRYDGSTRFAPGKQWGAFPAASAAWRISSEDFMKNFTFITDLKLRASYGVAGNNNISSDQWRVLFTPSVTRPYGAGDVANPYYTYASSQLTNPDVRWETTITRNIGLDFTLFNKVNGTLDFYHNTTKDLLVQSAIPPTTGFPTQQRNIGQTSNRGIELALNATVVSKKDLNVELNFNIGINRARIDKLDGVDERLFNSNWAGTDLKSQDDYRLYVGQTIGLMYGYVTDGMYSVDDFDSYDASTRKYILKSGVPSADLGGIGVRPGTLKLKDLDDSGDITAADRKVIGNALPKATGGFGVSASYKGFDVTAFFNWVYGNSVYNTGKISFNMLYRTSYGNMLNTSNYDNRFHYINSAGELVTDLKQLAALNPNPKIWSPFSMGTASPYFHSWAVENGSFLRLNTFSIGYSVPSKLIKAIYMTKLRVYATVYNAFLITGYSGYDPEVSTTRSSGYSQLTPGVDYSAYPKSRSYTVGVNVTF
ncbi:TonB-linked outer membrane protein, SusC/RagA family [Filimonas lacunae]|uniref:TonB-linked outer membrane protein, SusC/RagA family n=1 Tax=Filimonas lacunae TaxID=477680 RepID=A0A173MJ86_9BACT|nr:TonB-dependent receptor [Filimonas lacunae]BAV07458.1 TonB-dependent receptor [Filimonas lacunae]SIT30300.1 TonB-linked outer membrane protein, SusC/RagA family [Filimonas lacunae]